MVLGGNGSMLNDMKRLVSELDLNERVNFTGRLSKDEVVNVLHSCNLYCQSSSYETFSVICAEALMTGTPVVVSNVGGVREFVNEFNGVLVDKLEVPDWTMALESCYSNYDKFNKNEISNQCIEKFNSESVGKLYYSELMKVVNEK